MDKIYELVRSIVIYLILVTIIMNLVGKSSYRKYISIFTGMVLIIIVTKPIMNLFNLSDTFNYYFKNNLFKIEAKDLNDDLVYADQAGKQAIIDEYEKAVKEQINITLERNKLYASKIDVLMDTKEDRDTFCTVTQVDIVAAFTREDSDEKKEKIAVDKIMINQDIKINKDGKQSKTGKNITGTYEKIKQKIIAELSNAFQIKKEQIQITILDE